MSPRALARIGGVLYLIIIALGTFGEMYVRSRIVVPGDAAVTAANLRSLEPLWRFSASAELFYLTCAVALGVIFFILLRPVSRDLALLALCFNVVSIAIEANNRLHLFAALGPLGSAPWLEAFAPAQLDALARLAVRAHAHGFAASLLFFGCECLILGYLIARSGYLPRILGFLMAIAGLCYLINSYAYFLAPPLASRLFPAILVPAFVAESSLCLWLIVKGVNQPAGETARARPPG